MGIRDGLHIPSRIAPILTAETDERQVHQILDEEIRRTLGSLSQNLRVSYRKVRNLRLLSISARVQHSQAWFDSSRVRRPEKAALHHLHQQ